MFHPAPVKVSMSCISAVVLPVPPAEVPCPLVWVFFIAHSIWVVTPCQLRSYHPGSRGIVQTDEWDTYVQSHFVSRFEKEPSFCVLCGLCVRYCAEVNRKNAIGFGDRGVRREVAFIPEIASKECWKCKECFPLCPTEALQATFLLTKALISPSLACGTKSKE